MFHAVILGSALDAEGERILDCIEEAQDWLSPDRHATIRRYDCGLRFEGVSEAVAWFEAQAVYCDAEAHRHVEFGSPGKNAP